MKNRFFKGTLILLVLLSCGTLFKTGTQAQLNYPKFKVAVFVQCDENLAHQAEVEGAIKRELRTFGDVQIVGNDLRNGLWDYRIRAHLFGITEYQRTDIRRYAICIRYDKKVPIHRFDPDWQAYYRDIPVIEIPKGSIAIYGINKLGDLGEYIVTDFDKSYLQPPRDIYLRFQ